MLYISNTVCDVQDAVLYLSMSAVMQPRLNSSFCS